MHKHVRQKPVLVDKFHVYEELLYATIILVYRQYKGVSPIEHVSVPWLSSMSIAVFSQYKPHSWWSRCCWIYRRDMRWVFVFWARNKVLFGFEWASYTHTETASGVVDEFSCFSVTIYYIYIQSSWSAVLLWCVVHQAPIYSQYYSWCRNFDWLFSFSWVVVSVVGGLSELELLQKRSL